MHRRDLLAGAVSGAFGVAGISRLDLLKQDDAGAAGAPPAERAPQHQTPHQGSHRVVWSVENAGGLAALTFDDGPTPELTPRILDVLDRYGVGATFLMMGHNVARHPGLVEEVVAAGHEVGNHTWSHVNLNDADEETTRTEIERGADAIAAAIGARPTLFRPPRGQMSGWGLRYAALSGAEITLMWSITRGVKDTGTPDAIAQHLAAIGSGDVACLHDGLGRGHFNPDATFTQDLVARREVEVAALPRVIEEARARGITLVTVSELLAAEQAAPSEAAAS